VRLHTLESLNPTIAEINFSDSLKPLLAFILTAEDNPQIAQNITKSA